MGVRFYCADIKFSLRNRSALKKFIEKQIRKTPNFQISKFPNSRINLSFVFCSDEYLLNINRQFLKHDYYTDIITFPLNETKEHIEAEIYISVERVRENALKFTDNGQRTTAVKSKIQNPKSKMEQDFRQELLRVMFHGVLHLLGYKDKTRANKLEMRKMEEAWLKLFGKQ